LTVAATEANRDEQLAWEARQRPRAAIAALVGAVFGFGANILTATAFTNAPKPSFLRALQVAAQPGPVGNAPSQRVAFFQYYTDHHGVLILNAIAQPIAYIAIAWLLTFLAAAVRARHSNFPRFALYLGLVGGIVLAIATLLNTFGTINAVNDFLDGPKTVDAARDIGTGSLLVTAGVLQLVGTLALAAGFFFVALNAMRVGLLTRFMGMIGIIVGVFVVIPLGPLPAVVQAFWLLTLGLILLGFGRGGLPPAWRTGKAEPWPTAQRGGGGARRPAPAGPDTAEQRHTAPQPVARPGEARRKRKRRT
jgi:hypothetical protein